MFGKGSSSIQDSDILSFAKEENLVATYLNVVKLPCTIKNPMREDKFPSLGLFITPDKRVRYRDFATGDGGSAIELVCKILGITKEDLYNRVKETKTKGKVSINQIFTENKHIQKKYKSTKTKISCRFRSWTPEDIAYWKSYGVPLNWLQWSEVFPISHIIYTKNNQDYVFGTDPLAYAFIEHKEGEDTMKIYQPYNKAGKKWLNSHDKSVISLWNKIPDHGEVLCFCSSLKDSLCLFANTGIPALCMQGEGYLPSKAACDNLKKRYKQICIMLDNDDPGKAYAQKFAEATGFKNITLPCIDGAKDISDLYHKWQDKEKFKTFIINLFKSNL